MNKKKHVRRGVSLLLALLMLLTVAQAEKLTFPNGLKQIEAEAFMGDKAITSVELPNGMTALGDRAFANCSKLKTISIPGSVTSLGADILKGCTSDVLIKTEAGSAAADYARQNHIDYQAGTKYRALLVGQTYLGSDINPLLGPANDIVAMARGLLNFGGTEYDADDIWLANDLDADEFAQAIWDTFADATEQDVSLFYYSGHGTKYGWLVGYDGNGVGPAALREALDKIPGRKIVLIDACFSGKMIGRDGKAVQESNDAAAQDFVSSFMSAFTVKTKSGDDLRGSEYFVITASSGSEESIEIYSNLLDHRGVFTQALLKGCGYDYLKQKSIAMHADTNGNNVITLQEAYAYAYKQANVILSSLRSKQHAQVYPENCNWFGLFRK